MGAPLREGRIDFVRLPKPTAFHATGDDQSLAGDVSGQSIGREEHCGVGDVIRPADLGEGHGRSDFFDHGNVAQFGLVTRDDGPSRANAIDSPTAVVLSMGSDSVDFVF